MALSGGRGTTDPLLTKYLLASHINNASGGAVIAPWEVDGLPDVWIDAAQMLVVEYPQMRHGKQQVDDHLAKWRAEHRKRNG